MQDRINPYDLNDAKRWGQPRRKAGVAVSVQAIIHNQAVRIERLRNALLNIADQTIAGGVVHYAKQVLKDDEQIERGRTNDAK